MSQKISILLLIVLLFVSCTTPSSEVNIYSGRHYQADEKLFREFTQQTGIKVNLIKADTDQLINRIKMEGSGSPADLLITADAGRLIAAREAGLLQPMESALIDSIVPKTYRDPLGYWTGLTKRARVIVYHQSRINPDDITSYEDLAHERWKGRILVRSSQNHYNQTLMASIIAALGSDKAETWASAVVNNMARSPRGNDRDQVKAIVANEGDIAIVNTYYLGLLLHSPNEAERQVAHEVGIIFPNQDGRGTHINISGIGLTAHSKNKENAIRLVEFLLGDYAQGILSENNHEYPISMGVEWPEFLKTWGMFIEDTIALDRLSPHLQESMFVFNRAGWQ